MPKLKQILLTKQLVVNLGKDEDGQQKTITLPMGLQEVDAEVADHWFVKAHAQEITPSIAINQELQNAHDLLTSEHEALKVQSAAADVKIIELEKSGQAKDKEIEALKVQLAKAQTPPETKPDPKAK